MLSHYKLRDSGLFLGRMQHYSSVDVVRCDIIVGEDLNKMKIKLYIVVFICAVDLFLWQCLL